MAAQAPAMPAIRLTWWIDDPRMRRLLLRLFAAALAVFIGIPLLTLVLWSFAGEWFWPNLIPTQWSLRWWQEVLDNPRVTNAMFLSFTIAPVVTLLTAVVAIPASPSGGRCCSSSSSRTLSHGSGSTCRSPSSTTRSALSTRTGESSSCT